MNNIKTEPSSHDKNEEEDGVENYHGPVAANTDPDFNPCIVKKEDEEEAGDDDDDNPTDINCNNNKKKDAVRLKKEEEEEDSVQNNNGAAANTNMDLNSRKVKKEEEANDDDGDDDGDDDKPTSTNCKSKNDDNDDDDYTDWKVGNWCWVLPSTTTTTTTNNNNTSNSNGTTSNHSIRRPECKKRTASTSSSHNTPSINNEDTTPKKKKARSLPPRSPPSNTSKKNTTVKQEDDKICENNEPNNKTNDVDDGYESWTEGNWCLLLPTGSSCTSTTVKIRTEQKQQHSLQTSSSTTTKRRKQPTVRGKQHRNCRTSYQTPLCVNDTDPDKNNEFDKDYSDNDDDENYKSKKPRTHKNTINYTKTQDRRWNEMFRRLVSYKKQKKSITVPHKYAADPKLATWVNNQRSYYKNKAISDHRVDLLNSIGFVWNALDNQWEEMFQKLVSYKKQLGSTLVPFGYQADPKLGKWVVNQRRYYKESQLCVDRIQRLESIGFAWDPFDTRWMQNYNRLVVYKKQHNSTHVPSCYNEENQLPPLDKWVSKQRGIYRDGKLLKKREELLNSIDFEWEVK